MLPSVALLCIGGMLAFETEGRTWRTMPEVVILWLPEQTITWNLFVVCWQKTIVPLSKWLLIVWILEGDSSLDCNQRLGKKKDLREICSSRLDHRAKTRTRCLLPGSSFNGTRWMFLGKYHYQWRNMVFRLQSGHQTTECRVGGTKLSKTKETAISKIASEDDVNFLFFSTQKM